jgi:hypothetical protein
MPERFAGIVQTMIFGFLRPQNAQHRPDEAE